MEISLSNVLSLKNPPASLRAEITERLTIDNPKFAENERMGRWNGGTSRLLRFYSEAGDALILPRGYIRHLLRMCKNAGVPYRIADNRRTLPLIDFRFSGRLRQYQEAATQAMLRHDFGTLAAPTGSGKTVIALSMIAARRQPALIVTHTKELLNQWADRIETFLSIPKKDIGVIGSGKHRIGNKITVGLIQTLCKAPQDTFQHFGYVIVDECHRTPSKTFTDVLVQCDAKYATGLSATPWRRDGLSKVIFWYAGDVVHQIDKDSLLDTGDIVPIEVIHRETDFRTSYDMVNEYSSMLSELTEDADRNRLIATDVAKEARNGGGICLVLSDRKAHCATIQGLLKRKGIKAALLTGGVADKDRKDTVEALNKGKIKVVCATGQLIGEGFDCKGLSTLFLATPIKFDGRLLQYVGRVMRPAPGKDKAKLYDYVDENIPVLVASARARERALNKTEDRRARHETTNS